MYQNLCTSEKRSAIFRIGIIQSVFYTLIIGVAIFGAIYFNEDFNPHDEGAVSEDDFYLADSMYIIIGMLNLIPLLLSVMLSVGVVTEKYELVRMYILLKIFETIINTILLLVICILIANSIHSYYAILICAMPVVIAIWMLEAVVNVNSFYTEKMAENKNTEESTQKSTPTTSNVV